jgi:hypothetical protein
MSTTVPSSSSSTGNGDIVDVQTSMDPMYDVERGITIILSVLYTILTTTQVYLPLDWLVFLRDFTPSRLVAMI